MCRDLGIQTIYAPAPPPGERDGGEAEWTALGRELDRIGKIVTAEGLKFGWHNHHWEYGKAARRQALHRHPAGAGAGLCCGKPTSPGSCAAVPIRSPS